MIIFMVIIVIAVLRLVVCIVFFRTSRINGTVDHVVSFMLLNYRCT